METERLPNSFLGTGFKFPVQVDKLTGRLKTSAYENDIAEAIPIILGTGKGERVMRPEFGSSLKEYIFETMDYTTVKQIEQEVEKALLMWEPRITELDVEACPEDERDGILSIRISYVVRSTNNPYNLVYPYYIKEGMD